MNKYEALTQTRTPDPTLRLTQVSTPVIFWESEIFECNGICWCLDMCRTLVTPSSEVSVLHNKTRKYNNVLWRARISLSTCPLFWRNLFEASGELELSGQSSSSSASFLIDLSMEKLEDRRLLAFLVGFVLLPVMVVCTDTLGVLTTKDERDLSFLLAGNGSEAATASGSGAFTFLPFKGKILALTSCLVWSGLINGN